MSDTYTQIHIQAIFAVRNREALISTKWRDRLYQYITSIVEDQGHKMLAIGGTANHVHLLFGFRPNQSLSSLMLRIKRETSEWINNERLTNFRFQWQKGYGAFSYTRSHVPVVTQYILNQESHHAKRKFKEEYLAILRKNEVKYDERYVFEDISSDIPVARRPDGLRK